MNYFLIRLLFTLSISTREFSLAGSVNDSNIPVSDDPLVSFLRLELKTCGFVRWCTINVTVNEPVRAPCCQGCTCDSRCELSNSCCPDYMFGNQTSWRAYTTVPDFVDAVLNWTASTREREDQGISDVSLRSTIASNGQCLQAQVMKTSKYREDGGTFHMISECPPTYDADTMTKTKCELDYHNGIESGEPDSKLSFEDLVPVTSRVDGQVYKNSHCLACNSLANDSFSSWTISVLCSRLLIQNIFYEHFANPNYLLLSFALYGWKLTDCNIIFETDRNLPKTFQNRKCELYDFDKCPHNNTTAYELCARYVSPVYDYTKPGRNRVIYKNSACMACREHTVDVVGVCSTSYNSRRLKLSLNVPREMARLAVTQHVDELLHARFPGDTVHGCIAGEMYDRKADVCRKIYCPKGMFAFRGECHNFFRHVEGGVFSVVLRLIPTARFLNHTEVAVAIYNSTILRADQNPVVAIKSHAVWCNSETKFLLTLSFSLDQTSGKEGTFSNAIKFTDTLIRNMRYVRANTQYIQLNVSLEDSARSAFREYIDVSNGDVYSRVYPLQPLSTMNKYSILEVTEEHFCFRVSLSEEEFTRGDFALELFTNNELKTSVYHYTPFFNDPRNNLVCLKHVMTPVSEINMNLVPERNIHESIPQLDDQSDILVENVMEEAIAPLLLALTVVLALGTCLARRRLAQRALRVQRDSVELTSM